MADYRQEPLSPDAQQRMLEFEREQARKRKDRVELAADAALLLIEQAEDGITVKELMDALFPPAPHPFYREDLQLGIHRLLARSAVSLDMYTLRKRDRDE